MRLAIERYGDIFYLSRLPLPNNQKFTIPYTLILATFHIRAKHSLQSVILKS